MTRLKTLFIFLLPTLVFGQYKSGFLTENFFGRLPSARAEAMGQSYVSIDGDLTSIYFNPAGISTIKGLELNGSYTPPTFYLANGGFTSFFAAGCRINKYLQVAVSRFRFDWGNTPISNTITEPYSERNVLTISSQPIKNFYLGLNTNYFVWQSGVTNAATSIFFDFGAIKKFQFLQKASSGHSFSIGTSITNLNYSTITLNWNGRASTSDLPVITRYGANYSFTLDKHLIVDTLKTLVFLMTGDYQKLLNSDYRSAYRFGGELMLFEIFSFRAGYYNEKVYDYGYPSANNNQITSFTYGFGLQLPVYKLTKIPLNINFDYTSLPQPSYSKINTTWTNFTTYSVRLNWIFKTKT
jgi:hypothetical protein